MTLTFPRSARSRAALAATLLQRTKGRNERPEPMSEQLKELLAQPSVIDWLCGPLMTRELAISILDRWGGETNDLTQAAAGYLRRWCRAVTGAKSRLA